MRDRELGAGGAASCSARASPTCWCRDIGMPGEDGYALIRQVRALPPEEGGADAGGGAHRLYARGGPDARAARRLPRARGQAGGAAELVAVVASLAQYRPR